MAHPEPRPPETPADRLEVGQAWPARKPRLLLVDDQPVHLQVLYRALTGPYQLFMATRGEQALHLVREQQPDLVLLDVVMPDMDGFEVLRRLRAARDRADTPVIFVTAHEGADIESRCLEAGAVDFISKPVNPAVVRARVRTHLTLKFQSDLLRALAFIDGLTGVANRRHFDERLALEWGRAQRLGTPLSLILADVDHFKAYNDHYGHQAGDAVLRHVAQTLRAHVRRPADMVARYGGEEFACLLPDTPLADAQALAERMQQAVRDLAIPHRDSRTAPVVTASFGVAAREGPALRGAHPALLLGLADAQLYEAKHQGRARVCAARLEGATGDEVFP
ncbi:diguanylate cyclase domain-containing protein [Tepidimonas charontis]|uniref:diguanylate cyclase n=1 Tax=Tepidimonas charontis TaxID=2267262 RepID=A0A554X4A2_9BURK|nr:diguanylate cyclase [Tepidimonas charontis]TSE30674.1 Response regulator PleD [Tepidimonas charontis]